MNNDYTELGAIGIGAIALHFRIDTAYTCYREREVKSDGEP